MEAIEITNSVEETRRLGQRISDNLTGSENLLLVGDLGSGKTALTQGLAEGLGIVQPVKSPTYIYLQEYQLPLRSTRLAHYDLYRLPGPISDHDLHSIDLPERLSDRDTITVIEWGDRMELLLQKEYEVIRLTSLEGDRREIRLPKKLLRASVR